MSETVCPFNPLDPAHLHDPIEPLTAARLQSPVSLPRPDLACVVSDDGVRQVLGDPVTYSNHGNFAIDGELELPAQLITMIDPPDHTELRNRLLRWFAPARLRALEPQVQEIVDHAINALPPHGEVELYEAYVRAIPTSVVFAFMGLPEHLWRDLERWSDVIAETMPEPLIDLPAMTSLIETLTTVVQERRTAPAQRDDVIDGLIHPIDDERQLTDIEIMTHLLQLVLAATDTTRSLITNTVHSLLTTGLWEQIADDPDLVASAIEESLRLDTPLQFVLRTALADDTIEDTEITAGSKLLISLQSANRDEKSWGADAAQFQLGRPAGSAHLAFGRGIHTCIGAPLARLESIRAIHALARAYPRMRIADGYQWEKGPAPMMRRPTHLTVVLD